MSFDWSAYLGLARVLAQSAPGAPSPEAYQRAAISRAYYAAFISARNHLRDVDGLLIPRLDVHQYVIRRYGNSRDHRRQRIGRELSYLRQERAKVDYDDVVIDLPLITNQALGRAARIIAELNRL